MSNNVKRWKILKWDNKPDETHSISLCCPHCGTDQELEVGPMPGGNIIAAIGLGLIFDPAGYRPPENSMPNMIKCRHCRREFTDEPYVR